LLYDPDPKAHQLLTPEAPSPDLLQAAGRVAVQRNPSMKASP